MRPFKILFLNIFLIYMCSEKRSVSCKSSSQRIFVNITIPFSAEMALDDLIDFISKFNVIF